MLTRWTAGGGAAIRITLFFYSVRYILTKLDSVTGYPFYDRTALACDKMDGRHFRKRKSGR